MTTKERLHQLLDQLPESELEGAERVLTDPLIRALLNAPGADPPLTPDEIAGVLEAKLEIAEGKEKHFASMEDGIRWLHEARASEKP